MCHFNPEQQLYEIEAITGLLDKLEMEGAETCTKKLDSEA
jgi:hypothetical protein